MKKLLHICLLVSMLLGCHNGYVALWSSDSETPAEIYPYRVTSLPPADQEALKKGIPVENSQDLAHLLEDYLS